MKTCRYISKFVFASILCSAGLMFGQGTTQQSLETRVALRSTEGKYVSIVANGGLDVAGKVVTNKSVFVFIDANGAALEAGDHIKIKYQPGGDPSKDRPSFWQIQEGVIKRVAKAPKDESGSFKLKKQGDEFVLETAGGKFVGSPKDGGLSIVESADGAIVLTLEENPSVK